MRFSVLDRLVLGSAFVAVEIPCDFIMLGEIRQLREELSLSGEEIKQVGLMTEKGNTQWDPEKDPNKEIEITEMRGDLIMRVLKTLNAQKRLKDGHFELYKTFVVDKEAKEGEGEKQQKEPRAG